MEPLVFAVHQTMPSEYQEEKSWSPLATSVLWSVKVTSDLLDAVAALRLDASCDRPVTMPYRRPASIARAGAGRPEKVTVKMQLRTRTALAWSLWLASFGCCAGGLVVTLALTRPLTAGLLAEGAVYALVFPLGYATIGLVLSLRRPANPIGWLYAASGLTWSVNVPLRPWIDWLVQTGRPLPLAAQLAAAFGEFIWAPAIALGVTLPFLLLPEGRLRSRRWWAVVVASLAGSTLALVGGAFTPAPLTEVPIDNPLGLAGVAGTVATVVGTVGSVLHTACLPLALICVVLRFRASRGVERQQLRWVAAGAAFAVVGLLAGTASPQQTALSGVLYATVLCVPVAVAVAVLRYRLWDLDRLISRTVTYALLTALLGAVYAGVVLLPAQAFGDVGGEPGWVVAAATLAVAALFQPARRRIQAAVDRRFNRRRYDAARTVQGFAARLRDQVDLEALRAELLGVVEQTVQPTQASLWLRPPAARSSR